MTLGNTSICPGLRRPNLSPTKAHKNGDHNGTKIIVKERAPINPNALQSTEKKRYDDNENLHMPYIPPFDYMALLPTEWVISDRFSDFWQPARQDFEAEVLFVSKSVGPSLDDTDLVVDPFNET